MTIATAAGAKPQPRTLILYAPTDSDPVLRRQRELLQPTAAAMVDRDLVLVTVIGQRPGFEAVLVGKDGGEKLRSTKPIGPDSLFATIDAMPMRRQELRRQR